MGQLPYDEILWKMKQDPNTVPESQYVVNFNREIARTLTYDDSLGRLLFVFDIVAPKSLALERTPLENNRVVVAKDEAIQTRIAVAFERTKAYLLGLGYEVTEV